VALTLRAGHYDGNQVGGGLLAAGYAHGTIQSSKGVFDILANVLSHTSQSGHDVVFAAGCDALNLKNTNLDKLKGVGFCLASRRGQPIEVGSHG
jgi:hypothetical protein